MRLAAAILALLLAAPASAQLGVSVASPDATTTRKGKVRLANHLGGTAANPTVVGGAADTAAALLGNPTDCSSNQFATAIAASGNLTCAALTDSDVPNGITVDLATAATALAANPTDCSANQFATTIAASGNLTCAAITDADVPNSITIDNATLAATATALAANGANCSAGNYPLGVSASGAVESCTADDDTPEAADYSNLTAGTGITNSPTGTLNATLGTAIDTTEITDATIAQDDINDTATLASNSLPANACYFATTGIICEGATADGNDGLLVSANVTADRTWTLPDATGTLCVGGGACATLNLFEGAADKGFMSIARLDSAGFDVTGSSGDFTIALGTDVSLLGQTIEKAETTDGKFVFNDQTNDFGGNAQNFNDIRYNNDAAAENFDCGHSADGSCRYSGNYSNADDIATKGDVDGRTTATFVGGLNIAGVGALASQKFWGVGIGAGAVANNQSFLLTDACSLNAIRAHMRVTAAGGAAYNVPSGNRVDVVVRKNNTSSNVTCSIAAGSNTCSGSLTESNAAGDFFDFAATCVNVGSACSSATAATIMVTWRCGA